MAQLCLTLYFDCWEKKKSIDVYVAVCSEFIAEWGCPCPCQAKGQEAPSLTPSSKSSRGFKHKPICERIFCSNVIHFSLGIPSQTSGVLLASKLPCVFMSLTARLSTLQGVWCFCFHFSCWEKWCFHVSFQYLTYSHGAGGRGRWGTIAIFKDALENNHEHISTVTSTITSCWPSDTFKRKRLHLFFLKWSTHRQLFLCYSNCLYL